MHCRSFRSAGSNHYGVFKGTTLAQHLNHIGHRCGLLPDRYVDANDIFTLLVDDRIDSNGGLARLTIADDQLALATADRDHGVNRGDPRLHRLMHRLALDDSRRHRFDQTGLGGCDRPFAVDWLTQRIHHPTQHGITHRNGGDFARCLDRAALLNAPTFAHQHCADIIVLKVEGDPFGAVLKLD